MESTIEQTEKSIESKNKEIESLKEKEKEYNDLNIEKIKYEKEINYQLKNLLSLNDQINKKNRQIKEDEKLMISFENHIKALHERESEIKIEESKVEEQERKKKEIIFMLWMILEKFLEIFQLLILICFIYLIKMQINLLI